MDKLQEAWEERKGLRAKGDKLYAEGYKLKAEGNKLSWIVSNAKSHKLTAEGDKLFAKAVLEVKGNITLKWRGMKCYLETGEVFK